MTDSSSPNNGRSGGGRRGPDRNGWSSKSGGRGGWNFKSGGRRGDGPYRGEDRGRRWDEFASISARSTAAARDALIVLTRMRIQDCRVISHDPKRQRRGLLSRRRPRRGNLVISSTLG